MGKYEYIQPNPWNEETERKVRELNNIANELAEANRLKRWEMDLAHSRTISNEGVKNILQEVEKDGA